ncbi:primosomal replication protein N [Algibacillus agarilyticus]|uniref:primosomal replication protein N n=1 Tax=Algibacillus agarilyticus TaxID=2234133 RepID=UPI000DD002B5|nr:primosomal replication protein N [Algibacillus agarilyticus]
MNDNTLVISGFLPKDPAISKSPAGVVHCQFVLEHESEQYEAGLPRRVWCRIKVVASGGEFKSQTEFLKSGCRVQVTGFLVRVEGRNGLAQLVLHARQINITD